MKLILFRARIKFSFTPDNFPIGQNQVRRAASKVRAA
jgi:hypothetical protein